jgi:DNA-3-methyladenine glycosylase
MVGMIGIGMAHQQSKRAAISLDPSDKMLRPSFFNRDADSVARDLIGSYLVCRRGNEAVLRDRITETEAYVGPHDLACHASRGRTERTETMFGPPGTFYVYLVYGLHWMLNVVTGPIGYPAAVLIRSLESTTGPGRLTNGLGITGALDGRAADERSGLWFAKDQGAMRLQIVRTPRIGVEYAGPIWSAKKYRFVVKKAG